MPALRSGQELESARNLMAHTVNHILGLHRRISLIESIFACQCSEALRKVYPAWPWANGRRYSERPVSWNVFASHDLPMPPIPESYLPEPIDPATLPGWLGWSLPFFSAPVLQNPHVDMTLQLDVTNAFAQYRGLSPQGGQASFFAFLVWHLAQTLAQHPSFNLRCVDGYWYVLHNPPIFIPVAVGGDVRFRDLVLENVYQQDWPTFLQNYQHLLALARSPEGLPPCTSEAFCLAHFMGNLPNLRFSGLTLHWRSDQSLGQSSFYFGQRYAEGERTLIPLAVRMHHSCTDPFVLNGLIADFQRRFALRAG